MSLTSGRGPLNARRAGWFTAPVPEGVAYVEPFRRRVRGLLRGETVVDSEQVLLVHRPGGAPVWAFPPGDVHGVDARPMPEVPDRVEVAWNAVDEWYQERDRVLLHAPNPYHRVEYVHSDRPFRVTIGGADVVDTSETIVVYETALEPRIYVSPDAVAGGVLLPGAKRTLCPYKGEASWWTARVGDVEVVDAAWSYDDPLREAAAIRRMICFDPATEDANLAVIHALPDAARSQSRSA